MSEEGVQLSAVPELYPAFDPAISDYVVRATPFSTVEFSVTAPNGTQVSLDGLPFRAGSFVANARLNVGERVTVVVNTREGGSTTYQIRCIPSDFPTWTAERPGTPQAEWYIVTPTLNYNGSSGKYVVVFDSFGVPVWWFSSDNIPADAKLFPKGTLAWANFDLSGTEERRLDGSIVGRYNGVGDGTDPHEVLRLPNGNIVLAAVVNRGPVDLSSFGGSSTATLSDQVIEEIGPDGTAVWSWDTMDHVPVSETDTQWWQPNLVSVSPADPFHFNSIEPVGDGYILSYRHLDAIIKIDNASGSIVWKLGGTHRPESLTIVGDPVFDAGSGFGGQHDARVLRDGTLTLHDNGTGRDRPPRAVRYRIDTEAKTATFIEQVTDPDVPASLCCGDATKMDGGNWVMSWGGTPYVTELTESGDRVFRLTFGDGFFSYRAHPIPYGLISREALRNGMNAQFPHQPSSTLLGDLDGDGRITPFDIQRLMYIYLGLVSPTEKEVLAGDLRPVPGVNGRPFGDGQIEGEDLNGIMRLFVGSEAAL